MPKFTGGVEKLPGPERTSPLQYGARRVTAGQGPTLYSRSVRGDLVRHPVKAEVGQLRARRIARRRIRARELVVRLPRALEFLRREGDACRRALASKRLEHLLGQHVGLLADALARVEGAQQVDAALARLQQLVHRHVPARAVAHQFHRLGGAVELPRRSPHELAET